MNIIIAKNNSGSKQSFISTVMEDGTEKALNDYYDLYLIQESIELRDLVADDTIVINYNGVDLSAAEALEIIFEI